MFDRIGRLIVLGASGFVGSNVVCLARTEGWEVIALSSKDIDLKSPESPGRISALVRDGDTVVHSAAIVPSHKAEEVIANLVMSQHVVEGLMGTKVAQFITVSSDAVYGERSGVINELTPCAPDSLYPIMCLARELVCANVEASAHTILRPTAIYGVGDTHNSYGPNRFAREVIKTGRLTLFGNGEAARDHVSIVDVAKVIVASANQGEVGVINIASGQSLAFSEVAEIVRAAGPEGTTVVNSGTEQTPTFRTFDISQLVRRFPNLVPIHPKEGIADMAHKLCQSAEA